ncbi:MAG: tetratricopeptide repeat protein [Bacillota bacterium]
MSEYQEVKSLVNRAVELKKEHKYEEALELLREGREEYPDNNYLLSSLADTYFRLNRLGRAEELARNILAEDPEDHNALAVRGNIAYKKLDYDTAVDFFRRAYRVNRSPYLASRLIRSLLKKGEPEVALDLCQEWLEENPDDRRFRRLKAEIYEKMDRGEEAEELFADYLQEEEDDFALREKLKLRLKGKSPEAAARELKNLLRLEKYGNNVHLHTLLAEKLKEQEKYAEAAEVYREALKLEPEDEFIRKNLGLTLHKAGEEEEALQYLREAFREEPGDYYLRTTLQYLFRSLERYREGMEYFRELIDETGLNNLWGAYKKLEKELKKDEQD